MYTGTSITPSPIVMKPSLIPPLTLSTCYMYIHIIRAANEPNEHEHSLVRVRLLRISCVHEQFTDTYRTRFFVRVRLLRK
ncbi:hypothetical protein Hanom_Chr13g01200721 [Helianthus anomalus]